VVALAGSRGHELRTDILEARQGRQWETCGLRRRWEWSRRKEDLGGKSKSRSIYATQTALGRDPNRLTQTELLSNNPEGAHSYNLRYRSRPIPPNAAQRCRFCPNPPTNFLLGITKEGAYRNHCDGSWGQWRSRYPSVLTSISRYLQSPTPWEPILPLF